jgi:hypothetical protein
VNHRQCGKGGAAAPPYQLANAPIVMVMRYTEKAVQKT